MTLLLLLACAEPPPAPRGASGPDVLLVSLDTTRADALSAWGDSRPVTPGLDALAASGVRFAWALSQSPTTLASHATVFTGLDPHRTQVVRNGFPLEEAVETLAERLARAGWHTAGVIGASALARPMGVDQGFLTWDESLSVSTGRRHEAPAAEVTDRALRAWKARPLDRPSLLFVHYYDAHAPFAAPAPYGDRWVPEAWRGRYLGREGELKPLAARIRAGVASAEELAAVRGRYLGEVSYVDAELSRLLRAMDLSRTVVVVFGDHGEALGEIPERPFGHGPDLDLVATHVPLLVAGPGVPAGRVVDRPVALQDVAATLTDLLGEGDRFGDGRSLRAAWEGDPAGEPRLLEATQPERDQGPRWNNLPNERGVLDGGSLLLARGAEDPAPTLYRVAPGQPVEADEARRRALHDVLRAWDAQAPPFRALAMTDAVREGLRALGYLE